MKIDLNTLLKNNIHENSLTKTMNFEELEKKEFNFKFSFNMLANIILFLQKIQQMHPDEDHPVNEVVTHTIDEIVDQLCDEDLESMNIYLKAINLENSLKKDIEND
tara:strand:+ start:1567 stop:1884 length:318 start_codon:yes stop_codon:yes gene_type:complete